VGGRTGHGPRRGDRGVGQQRRGEWPDRTSSGPRRGDRGISRHPGHLARPRTAPTHPQGCGTSRCTQELPHSSRRRRRPRCGSPADPRTRRHRCRCLRRGACTARHRPHRGSRPGHEGRRCSGRRRPGGGRRRGCSGRSSGAGGGNGGGGRDGEGRLGGQKRPVGRAGAQGWLQEGQKRPVGRFLGQGQGLACLGGRKRPEGRSGPLGGRGKGRGPRGSPFWAPYQGARRDCGTAGGGGGWGKPGGRGWGAEVCTKGRGAGTGARAARDVARVRALACTRGRAGITRAHRAPGPVYRARGKNFFKNFFVSRRN
jgi:hypothetical protein